METISAGSKEYVQCRVTAKELGLPFDPTALSVDLAFVAHDDTEDAPSTWYPGTWDTSSVAPNLYLAQCLVGPSGGLVTLVADTRYEVWVRVTGAVETPVIRAGTLAVTV